MPAASRIGTTLLVLAVAGVASACGSEPGRTGADGIVLPTREQPDSALDQLRGELRGDPERGCVWLHDPEASEARQRVSVVWPAGFSGRIDPIRIYEGDVLVATEGDMVEVVGSGITDDPDVEVGELGDCRVSDYAWLASEARRVGR
jgi:hypothetical protein